MWRGWVRSRCRCGTAHSRRVGRTIIQTDQPAYTGHALHSQARTCSELRYAQGHCLEGCVLEVHVLLVPTQPYAPAQPPACPPEGPHQISTRHAGWKHPPQIASGGSSGAAPSMSELPHVAGAAVDTLASVELSPVRRHMRKTAVTFWWGRTHLSAPLACRHSLAHYGAAGRGDCSTKWGDRAAARRILANRRRP